MGVTIKIGSGYNIVLPRIVIEKMKFTRNDELLVDIEDDKLVLMKKPKNYSAKLRGLHKEIWGDIDAMDYVKTERDSWE